MSSSAPASRTTLQRSRADPGSSRNSSKPPWLLQPDRHTMTVPAPILGGATFEVGQVRRPVAPDVAEHVVSQRSLDGHRRRVQLADLGIHGPGSSDRIDPEAGVGVRDREAPRPVAEPKEDGVVDERPLEVDHRGIDAAPPLRRRGVDRRHQLDQGVAVAAGQPHVVVGRDRGETVLDGCGEERGLAHPGVDRRRERGVLGGHGSVCGRRPAVRTNPIRAISPLRPPPVRMDSYLEARSEAVRALTTTRLARTT